MNLIIDQGNTDIKTAVFSEGRIVDRSVQKKLRIGKIEKILTQYKKIDNCIVSSVALFDDDAKKFLMDAVSNFIMLDENTPLPLKNNYKTKETLGCDRLANAAGAHTIFPGSDVLVVDTGTAITYDLVTAGGEFMGGNISPGLNLRFKTLHKYTYKLPLVEKSDMFPDLGLTTQDAVLSGVMSSVIFEIDGYINMLKELYPGLKTVLTGGDLYFFVKKLKNTIFVDQNITLSGLNRILEYNAK